ncbi:hypothetical protein B9D06_22105, partial [Mycobacterium tuberculosis]
AAAGLPTSLPGLAGDVAGGADGAGAGGLPMLAGFPSLPGVSPTDLMAMAAAAGLPTSLPGLAGDVAGGADGAGAGGLPMLA